MAPTELSLQDFLRPNTRFSKIIWSRDKDEDDDDDDDDHKKVGAGKNGNDNDDDDKDDHEKERQQPQLQPPAKLEQPTTPLSALSPSPKTPPPTAQSSRLPPILPNGSMDRSNSTSALVQLQPSSLLPSAQSSAPKKVPAGASAKSPTLMLTPSVDSSPDKPNSSLKSSPISLEPPVLPIANATNKNEPDLKLTPPKLVNADEIITTLSQLMNAPTPVPTASPFKVSTMDSILNTIPDFQKGPSQFDFPNPDNNLATTSYSKESTPTGAPRKEIDPTSCTTSPTSQTAALQRPTDPSISSQLSHTLSPNESNHGALSPLAEHILVALGAIGGFILLTSILFFIAGIKGKNPLYPYCKNIQSRHQERGFVELDRGRNDKPLEKPPSYSHPRSSLKLETYNDKQDILIQSSPQKYKQYEAFENTPTRLQRSSTLPNNPIYDLPHNTEPFMGQTERYVNSQLYGNASQSVPYEMTDTMNSFGLNYNNSGTSNMFGSLNTYGAISNQRISFASSISSGFGDGLILPAPTDITTDENKPSEQNWSQPPAVSKTRLSWFNGKRRDSYLSTSSVETAPRFRSVSSWVKHQSDELNRNPPANDESLPLHAAPQIYTPSQPTPKQFER